MNVFEKRQIALRYWLLGRGYARASLAFDKASRLHVGFRKDGVTPNFDHIVSVASHVRTFEANLTNPESTICAALLHDVPEDYGVSFHEIETEFGTDVATAVDLMNKKTGRNAGGGYSHIFELMGRDPLASVCKAADRTHNLSTMIGVFTPAKQAAYVEEVRAYFFPMLKEARRRFPQQEPVYENLKQTLRIQCEAILAANKE